MALRTAIILIVAVICFAIPSSLLAMSEEELAKQLANPVAALISLPFQFNYDGGMGPDDDGMRITTNIQPVIPVGLSQNWNLISRTILPVIYQDEIYPGAGSQFGLSDVIQSFFFSPKAPTAGGWIWGVGPAFLLPTGSDDLLTMDKWAAGPTGVALTQRGQWTFGGLINHVWSFAGDDDRGDISSTFIQPFVSYVTPSAFTYSLMTESTYDWENEQWSVPVIGVVSKMTNISGQMVSFAGGVRYWADAPDMGPEGVGFRAVCTFLFPK